jgi:vitamin B12 transporter
MIFFKFRATVACVPAAVLALLGGVSAGASAQTSDLGAVVVTATRTAVPLTDVLADVSVIDREVIEQSGGLTVPDLLRQYAGLQISSNGGLGNQSSVYLRGTESRHVLLLIDGVRYGSATLGTPNWDNLPLSAIDRIEVLRGPAASLYGSDAVGGVVQIFTRRGRVSAPQPYASATVGAYGRRELSGGVSGGSESVSYALGASLLRETGFSSTNPGAPFGNHNPDRDGFEQQSAHANMRWQVSPGLELGLQWLIASGDSQFDSSLNDSANFDVRGLTTTRTTGLSLVRRWQPGRQTSLLVQRADDLTRNLYRTEDTVFDTRRQQWTLQHEQATPLGTLTAGLEQVRETVDGTTRYTVRRRTIDGLFAGLQGVHEHHRWQASVRRDDNSQFGASTTGLLAYGYQLTAHWSASLSAGTSFKAPTFNQLYFPGFGNATTQPEKGRSQEAGLQYENGPTRLRLVYFDQSIRGFINNATNVSNIPRVEIDGWSLAGSHTTGNWRLHAHLELLDARNRTPGPNFGRKLQRRADEQLTLSVERALHGWWLGAHALLVSDRFENVANTTRLPGFGTLGLSAERALTDDWTLQVRLNNVEDKRYETAAGYNQPGRSLYATLNWRPGR